MALLLRPPDISALTGRWTPTIRSRLDTRVSVCSGKDLGMVVLRMRDDNFDGVRCLYGQVKQMSATTPFKVKEGEEKKPDYFVNKGYAIRTLTDEIPELFQRELNFDIYREDIVFKDPVNAFAGIDNYKSIFWGLRFHGRIFFTALWVEIISVWQPVDNRIMVRWTVHGIPRIPWKSRSRFDGTSEYKLDKNGKIYEHKVHNIALNGLQKFQILAMEQLFQSIGCPSTPNPTYFEFSSSYTTIIAPLSELSVEQPSLPKIEFC